MTKLPNSIFVLDANAQPKIYSDQSTARIAELTNLIPNVLDDKTWAASKALLADVEYIFSGWGVPPIDAEFLQAAPKLKHVFYGSGTIRSFWTEAAQKSGVTISSAWKANAVPTSEFAYATILLALKKFYRVVRATSNGNRKWELPSDAAGLFKSTVGLLSLGTIGQRVARSLRDQNQLNVIACDPFANKALADELGVQLVSLEELFSASDVVSLHAPDLPETRGMINEGCLQSMKLNATLINSARGHLIDEEALIRVFRQRCDLDALLDVTIDEPPSADSALWDIENITLTPHIAGSINNECQRMGEYMVEELERKIAELPLQHEVTPDVFRTMA